MPNLIRHINCHEFTALNEGGNDGLKSVSGLVYFLLQRYILYNTGAVSSNQGEISKTDIKYQFYWGGLIEWGGGGPATAVSCPSHILLIFSSDECDPILKK